MARGLHPAARRFALTWRTFGFIVSNLGLQCWGWVTSWKQTQTAAAESSVFVLLAVARQTSPSASASRPRKFVQPKEAAVIMAAAAAVGAAELDSNHATWWARCCYSDESGARLSLPAAAARFEQFHWIQVFKMGAENGCRRFVDSAFPPGVLDNCILLDRLGGPVVTSKFKYPFAIWDMNVEGSQWGQLGANLVEQNLALARRIPEQLPNLVLSVPPAFRNDSASITIETSSLSFVAACLGQFCEANSFPTCTTNMSGVPDIPFLWMPASPAHAQFSTPVPLRPGPDGGRGGAAVPLPRRLAFRTQTVRTLAACRGSATASFWSVGTRWMWPCWRIYSR